MAASRPPATDPDPALVWRWLGGAARPVVGWAFVVIGMAALAFGYIGVSGEFWVARQVPFIVSGGLVGLAFVFLGGIVLGVQDLHRAVDRITRLETLVADLHTALLARPDAPDLTATGNGSVTRVAVLGSGTTYHRPDCLVVQGKDGVEQLAVQEAADRGLTPCKLCEPSSATAAAAAR